jgi:hypothetical protein
VPDLVACAPWVGSTALEDLDHGLLTEELDVLEHELYSVACMRGCG